MSKIPVEELKELKVLYDEGIITDDEYSLLKRKALGLPIHEEENQQNQIENTVPEEEDSGAFEYSDQDEGYDIIEDMMKPSRDFISKMERVLDLGEEGFADALLSDDSPLIDILNAKVAIESDTLPYSIAEEEYEKLTNEDKAFFKSIADNPDEIASLHLTYGVELRNNYKLWNSYDADDVSSRIIDIMIQKAVADETVVIIEPNSTEDKEGAALITLDVAKELLYQEYSEENIRTVAESFLYYVNNNKPVPTYFQVKDDTRLHTLRNGNIIYNAIASCRELEMPHPECTTIEMDINYVVSSIFGSKHVGGLAIDPFQPIGLYLPKDMLLKILIHGMYEDQNNGGCEKREWGIGIPDYTEDDLMTKGELLNFAMQLIIDRELKENGYTVVSATDNTNAIANIVARKDEDYYLIAVTGYCDYEEPEIDLERRLKLQSLGDTFNASCYYAPVGFRSCTDLLRFNQCLALKGDGFYSKYEGLKEV